MSGPFGAVLPGYRAQAKVRRAIVFTFIRKAGARGVELTDITGSLWRHGSASQLKSATDTLRRDGLVERVAGGNGSGGVGRYRGVAERKVAV